MKIEFLCFLLLIELSSSAKCQEETSITNSIGMKFALVSAGSFSMGSQSSDDGIDHGKQKDSTHKVILSNSYCIGVFEVTQGQFEKVMRYNPSSCRGGDLPVETVSWTEADAFCKTLSAVQVERDAGRQYRLPTEAEWEYACRASSKSDYCCGESSEILNEFAWFGEARSDGSHSVGAKKPNKWGLFDMHGNVWEWCNDFEGEYSIDAATDPKGPSTGEYRVFRGGCWFCNAKSCRAWVRRAGNQLTGHPGIGFRVVVNSPALANKR